MKPCLSPHEPRRPADFEIPRGAIDAHVHAFGPPEQFPLSPSRPYTPAPSDLARLLKTWDVLGISGGVFVNPNASGFDNSYLLHALAQAPHRLRGVAVPAPETGEEELTRMHSLGVRGIRFNFFRVPGAPAFTHQLGLEALGRWAPLMRRLGWHAQIWITTRDLRPMFDQLLSFGVDLVIDHMAFPDVDASVDSPDFQSFVARVAAGQCWCKLSGANRLSRSGGDFADVDVFARSLLAANPARMIWGSDWPHIAHFDHTPPHDDELLAALVRWTSPPELKAVLVDNPRRLYGFAPFA